MKSHNVPQTVPHPAVAARATLVATPNAREVAVRRRLEALLVELRMRVDDDPGCGLGPKLDVVEADLLAGRLDAAAVELQTVDVGLKDRRAYLAETEAAIEETRRLAKGRRERVTPTPAGGIEVARDGLRWLARKEKILPVHERAGLRFRKDYELANGTGVMSSLSGACGGGDRGPTDAMLAARDRVRAALACVGTPLLRPYLELVAGQGYMLTDDVFDGEVRHHILPCRIAFDLVARHYGMLG